MATLNLELSQDEQHIVSAQRRLNRAKERLSTSQAMQRRFVEDHELEGTRSDPREIEAHSDRVSEDQALVARLESELDAANRAPEIRRVKEARGASLLREAKAIDAEIAAAVDRIEAVMTKATPICDAIAREFLDPSTGFRILVVPFKGSSILSRLKFWKPDFDRQRLAAYRAERARL